MTNDGLENNLWEPIQAFFNDLQDECPEKAVHHYTSANAAFSILENGRIWLTERAHLNDPSEISYGIEIARVALSERGRARDADLLKRKADDVFRDFRFFSANFSFERDCISQWENYADSGRGVVLSFGLSAFNNPKSYVDALLPGNPTAFVCPMSYGHSRLKRVIEAIIDKWDGANAWELLDYVLMISSMFKDESWASEREYRFFVHTTRENALKCGSYTTRARCSRLVEYLDLDIQNWKEREIDVSFPVWGVGVGREAPIGLEAQLGNFIRTRNIPIHFVWRSEA